MRKLFIGTTLVTAVIGGLVVAYLARSRRDTPPEPGPLAAAALVAGFDRAVAAATAISEPFHCAELAVGQEPARILAIAGREWTHHGLEVNAEPVARDRSLVLGVVADARGAEPATLAQIAEVHRQFTRARVEVVLSLGGMGQHRDELLATLGALVDSSWVLVAIPGDRESMVEHEAAIAALVDRRASIIDGARARLLHIDGVSIATLPGLAQANHLVAGADGCRHTVVDATTTAALLAARPSPRVWASYPPPRQRGSDASDSTLDGINVGEPELTGAIAAAGASLVLSAQVDDASLSDLKGVQAVPATRPRFLAAGAVEAMPIDQTDPPQRTGSALIVTVSKTQLRWRRIVLGQPTSPKR